jgi:glycosyltransferase involved in cell wall biosynthesis
LTPSQADTASAPEGLRSRPRLARTGSSSSGPSRTRLLFAINSLAGGGAERVFTSLLTRSGDRQSNYEMAVALLDEDAPRYDLPDWVRIFRLDCGGRFLRSVVRMNRLVSSYRPDLVLSFLTRANVAAGLAMAWRRKPFIVSERTNTNAQLDRSASPVATKALVRLVYPRAERVIAVSDGVAATLANDFGVAAERIEVINNPVDSCAIQDLAAEPPECAVTPADIVAMGRLTPEKNFELAIRGFARSGWPGRLILLGEGPLAADLQRLGNELGLADRLILAGFLRNPYAVIGRAGLFMLTSNHEGFSNSLLEAMSLGVPVVATDCPFSPAEILEAQSPAVGRVARGRGGVLVHRGDLAGLAEALALLRSSELRKELGSEGRSKARTLDPVTTVQRYWQVIDGVAARARLSNRAPGERRSLAGAD